MEYCLNLERIQQLMQQREITETQLAEQMNVSAKCLHRYLHNEGITHIPHKIFYPLRIILDTPLEELLKPVKN